MKVQRVIQGWGSVSELTQLFNQREYNKVFLVTGKGSYKRSGAEEALRPVLGNTVVREYNDFRINPKFEDVVKGVQIFHEFRPDCIMSVGGGTVMDMGKLINAFALVSGNLEAYVRGEQKIKEPARPFIAVPTTSGTGSEATHFAVVYLHGDKYSVGHQDILPDYVVLDPSFTMDLPPYITACTAMDALCQGIESYWSINATDESTEYSEKAIRLSIENIRDVVHHPDRENREAMQLAAFYGGKGINLAKTTAAHAFSYYITSKYGIPHGHAVGIMMGWVFAENLKVTDSNCNDKRGPDYVRGRLQNICDMLNIANSETVQEYWSDLMKELGLVSNAFTLNKDTLNELAGSVNMERLGNNPVTIKL